MDVTIQGLDGSAYPNQFVWKEIVPPERIVWLYGISKDDPHAAPTTVTLIERDAATEVTLRILFGTMQDPSTGSRRTLRARGRLRIFRGAKVFPQTTHNMIAFHL